MSSLLITNIKSITGITDPGTLIKKGAEMSELKSSENAWMLIENATIHSWGTMGADMPRADKNLDAKQGMLLPSFADSHTHIVFARSREEEFVMRIKGASYEEIANAGGGILNSATRLKACSEDELFDSAWLRLNEVIRYGTGSIEIKSGYGLSTEDELKMLRVIRRLKEKSPVPVKATFLGAHAFPKEYKEKQEGYMKILLDEMLPKIADQGLADYIDVFCDRGYFSPEQTERLIEAGAKRGLKAKIHANELGLTGGVQVATKMNALSADHLEHCDPEEIECFKKSDTIPVGLPNCSFFLGIPYAPAKEFIKAGLPFALASDFNPGSSPSGKMGFVMALGCIQMKLSPEESFNACTINGASAMELSNELGSIEKGKIANLILTKEVPSINYLPYAYNSEWMESIILNGKLS